MELDLKAASDAAVRFVDTLDEAEDVTLVEFDTSGPDQPVSRRRATRSSSPGFGTARLGRPDRAVRRHRPVCRDDARRTAGQHILLLYTDGGDSGRGMTATRRPDAAPAWATSWSTSWAIVENLPGSERLRQQSASDAAGARDRRARPFSRRRRQGRRRRSTRGSGPRSIGATRLAIRPPDERPRRAVPQGRGAAHAAPGRACASAPGRATSPPAR